MRRVLLLLASSIVGGVACADEAPVDEDVVLDARSDTGSAEEASADDTSSMDTGVPETAVDAATDSADTADTRPVCTGSQAEPNNTIPSAALLPGIDDCDSSGSTLSGVLAGGGDPDFWHYLGKDKIGCAVDPFASTKNAVRLCVFVACSSGTTNVKKCNKGTAAVSPGGLNGCCTDGPGDVSVDYSCPLVGSDDGADVFMRVDSPTATGCVPYEVSYHF